MQSVKEKKIKTPVFADSNDPIYFGYADKWDMHI